MDVDAGGRPEQEDIDFWTIGGPVDEVNVTFMFEHAHRGDPAAITSKIALEPSRAFKKGDPFGTSFTSHRTYTAWELKSEPGAIEEQLQGLLERLEPRSQAVNAIIADGYDCGFLCQLSLLAWNRRLTLMPETLRRVGELGVEIWWDMWCSEEATSGKIRRRRKGRRGRPGR